MKPCIMDTCLLKDKDEHIIGINLGWDFVAEHEFGIKHMLWAFGVKDIPKDGKFEGVKEIHNTDFVKDSYKLFKVKYKNKVYLCFGYIISEDCHRWNKNGYMNSRDFECLAYNLPLWRRKNDKIYACWDSCNFLIAVPFDKNSIECKELQSLALEFEQDSLCLAFATSINEKGEPNPWGNRGLCLLCKRFIGNDLKKFRVYSVSER